MHLAFELQQIKWMLLKDVIDTPGFSFQPRGPFELAYGHITPFQQICRQSREGHCVPLDGKNAIEACER